MVTCNLLMLSLKEKMLWKSSRLWIYVYLHEYIYIMCVYRYIGIHIYFADLCIGRPLRWLFLCCLYIPTSNSASFTYTLLTHRIDLLRHLPQAPPSDCSYQWCSLLLVFLIRGEPVQFSSVQSLSPVQLFVTPWKQHTRPPCLSPTPRVHPNSCASSRWCHPAISSSIVPFSSCPQSRPASGSFPMSQLFAWSGQGIRASATASVLPVNTQDWSPLGWTGWISLQSRGHSRVLSSPTVQKHQFLGTQLSSQSNSYIHTWLLEKP